MSSHKSSCLKENTLRPRRDKCHQKHDPREPHDVEGDHEERHLFAFVVLRVRVGEGENEGWRVVSILENKSHSFSVPDVKILPPRRPPASSLSSSQ